MSYQSEIESGRAAFGHLIGVWHGRNGWSHRVLPALAEALGLGRVHNSQLSNLRNGKLAAPGPELFLVLGRLNQRLAAEPAGLSLELQEQLADQPDLLAALQASALPLLEADHTPLGPAALFEIFVGLRQPPGAFDLRIHPDEATALSAALAELLTAGRPWRQCRDAVLAAYPVEKRQRRERFAAVMAGQREFSAPELEGELPDLCLTLSALGASSQEELSPVLVLELLRDRAGALGGAAVPQGPEALGEAIRQQLLG